MEPFRKEHARLYQLRLPSPGAAPSATIRGRKSISMDFQEKRDLAAGQLSLGKGKAEFCGLPRPQAGATRPAGAGCYDLDGCRMQVAA
jgi:hypothetical protein